ncbi:MAG: hypothetical protein SFX73_36170 [Kofleriaceae bacterium]|nr:hypothetical protein [Kofleriaceae bacterium]
MIKHGLVLCTLLGAACAPTKDEGKGVVDDSQPPSIPTEIGKGDASSRIVPVTAESAHPYANNLNKLYTVTYPPMPSCAHEMRVHFSVLRTETGYDFVSVEPTGSPAQEFDGNHDDTWTEWFPINGNSFKVRLESDSSVTRHGFEIDSIEWAGNAVCPAVVWPPCASGSIDINPPTPICGCPAQPTCANLDAIEIKHSTQRGFNFRSHHAVGAVATETHPGPADGPVTTEIGTVDKVRLGELVDRAANLGLLHGQGYNRPIGTATREELVISAGPYEVTFVAPEGTHDAAVAQLIADFEALFTCDTEAGTLTCATGFECRESTCMEEQSCVCPALYQPVCSISGRTYGNACTAACDNVEVAHTGECGIPGDTCGTMLGLACLDGNKCRFGTSQFTYPFPDAGGSCVANNYCDAPTDCNGLPHPAVPGAWACNTNACSWQAGASWATLAGGTFETDHPYANSASVWKSITLPANAAAMRLKTDSFALEANYDFLEVWAWQNGAWVQKKRYTGTTGPALAEELAGRYFYLRFVSDSSVTKQGFKVSVQYR